MRGFTLAVCAGASQIGYEDRKKMECAVYSSHCLVKRFGMEINMKNSRMKKFLVLGAVSLTLLSGCGDAPMALTEEEESLIVTYASQMVAKFNRKQKDGLTYVNLSVFEEDTEETELEEENNTEAMDTEENGQDTANGEMAEGETAEGQETDAKTLQDIFGEEGVSVSYVGYNLTKNYQQEDYFSMEAGAGKNYLVLNLDITNTKAEETTIDMLSKKPTIHAIADGVKSAAEVTILEQDFLTYRGTIPAGETVHTVLLFEVSDTVESVSELSLDVNVNGEKVTIIL